MDIKCSFIAGILAATLCLEANGSPLDWVFGPKVLELKDMQAVQPESLRGLVHLEPDPSVSGTFEPNVPGVPTSDSVLEGEVVWKFTPLIDGWEVRNVPSMMCGSGRLEAKAPSGEIVSIGLQEGRRDSFINRLFGGCSRAYNAVRLNQRFVAFVTAEPGWVFLDLEERAFVPVVLVAHRTGIMRLFADDDGSIYADIPADDKYGSAYRTRRPTLFRVDADGLHLKSPRVGPTCLNRKGAFWDPCAVPAVAPS